MQKPQPGEIYKHFKGNEYMIICVGKSSETEEEQVVYQDVYQGESDEPKIWIRPLEMFMDMKEVEGGEVRRFSKI